MRRGAGSSHQPPPVTVGSFTSRAEAELQAGYLRDKGIKAAVLADDEGGLAPNLAAMRRVRVLVPADRATEAQQLIDALD
jgi:hypothetical protein